MTEAEGSRAVMADPQFGMVRILRPFPTYTGVYAGQSAATPIVLSEGGEDLDSLAGTPGYAANLVAGVTVPFGARCALYLPNISYQQNAAGTRNQYVWSYTWRLRNVFDYRQGRKPFHFPRQSPGVSDTSGLSPAPRVIIPAADQTSVYSQTEPTGTFTRVVQHLRSEDLAAGADTLPLPLLPDGSNGIIQQGIFDPATVATAGRPSFQKYDFHALGDELVVSVYRAATGATVNWTFSGGAPFSADADFASFFTSTVLDRGVYLLVGIAP